MFTIIVSFVIASTGASGEGVLDDPHYATLELCEMARPARVEEFRAHVAPHGAKVTGSECSFGGLGGSPA
jgi:hypothetical protein